MAQIYQQCRTPHEIQLSFDELQRELEEQIEDRVQSTRKKLLEHFDKEVHEKLKVNLEESKGYLNKYESLLWILTKFYLKKDYASFSSEEYSFILKHNPFSDLKLPTGPYRFAKYVEDSYIYRLGHPIAQRIVNTAKEKLLSKAELIFDYSNSQNKISILEPLINKKGFIAVYVLTIETFVQKEDYLILLS